MAERWKNRPEGSNWGDFGPEDQLGRLNLLTPEKVRQGVAEVHEGLSFCLSLPLNLPGKNLLNPRRYAPVLRPTELDGTPFINFPAARIDAAYPDIISDDAVLLWTQYSSQWDSLAHVGQGGLRQTEAGHQRVFARLLREVEGGPGGRLCRGGRDRGVADRGGRRRVRARLLVRGDSVHRPG